MRFRLSRKRYTVSTPTIRMSPWLPWPIRWLLVAIVLGICAWSAFWIFDFGKNITGLPSTNHEVAKLRQEIEALKQEQEKNSAPPANSLIVAERATQEKLLERVKILEAENQALFEDLSFYQKLIPSRSKDSLSVRSLEVSRKEATVLDWEFLLIQTQRDASPTSMRVEVLAKGDLNGQAWVSPSPSVPLTHTVQQSTRLNGTLSVPEGLKLQSLSVKVFDGKTLRSSQTLENLQ